MSYVISQELAQALLNYLAQRPYAEVFELVAALQALPEAEEDTAIAPRVASE